MITFLKGAGPFVLDQRYEEIKCSFLYAYSKICFLFIVGEVSQFYFQGGTFMDVNHIQFD